MVSVATTPEQVEIMRAFIEPNVALGLGERVLQLYEVDIQKEFCAFRAHEETPIMRAYLTQHGDIGEVIDGALRSKYAASIHNPTLEDLMALDNRIESALGIEAGARMLQVYPTGAKLPKHSDWMSEAQSLNLLGHAKVDLFIQPSEKPVPIELEPGDLLVMHNSDKKVPHEVTNNTDSIRIAYTRHN